MTNGIGKIIIPKPPVRPQKTTETGKEESTGTTVITTKTQTDSGSSGSSEKTK
ncbi:hypothetical protein [Desulfobacca acetoxidans]|uniref:Uncharacterized protein n=1 Tax=Desulfobacca acetoxidans (strain ATCC 700848 / DSM 11109 / ASRB2) TaxID=880072 RepID=F2NBZ8_DESAR|nr:hypothetical protein [Desulfobacca acetoxidans]AEB08075.1 hypothetical protein Desac_0178 [Desulfobacca acetoxidans DSM 11109]